MFVATDLGGQRRGPTDDFWYYPVGTATAAGVRITPQTALAITAVFACALVLGQSLGSVPVHLYRRKERGRARAVEHPLYRLIHRRPNRWQTSFQWRQMMQWHLALRYNAYSEILSDRRGQISELVPLHPDRVRVERMRGPDGVVDFRYRVTDPGGGERILVRGEMFHVRGLTSDGIEGFSPLEAQSGSLGEALAAQNYSSRNLQNDARPGGVLEWEGHFKDDDDKRKFRASWQEAQSGPNRGKTAVLERGMTWKEIGIKNTDLQFIELRKLKGYDVAAMYRMPPHKIGLMEQATFTNIEHQAIEFVTDTLQPWCVNWEQELSAQLLSEDEQHDLYAEFALDGLMRGDAKTRAEYYGKRFQTGSLSPSGIAELENEQPIEGGDRYFVPVNMVPLDRVDDVVNKGGNRPAGPGDGGASNDANSRAHELGRAAAERVVRKEVAAQRRFIDDGNALRLAEEFYRGHISFVEDVMAVDAETAMAYCERRMQFVQAAMERKENFEDYLGDLECSGAADLIDFIRREHAA